MEQVARRDLVSAVTASGKIEAKTSVDISADITGRIIRIGGARRRSGDTRASSSSRSTRRSIRPRSPGPRAWWRPPRRRSRRPGPTWTRPQRAWNRARQLTQLGPNLIAPEAAEQAQTSYQVAQANFEATRAQLEQSRASLQEARDNLSKTRLTSPISGRVVRLAVEEGEVAVPGTFSRETGLLMTIADLSRDSRQGAGGRDRRRPARAQRFGQVTIDAYPDTTLHRPGHRDQPQRQAHARRRPHRAPTTGPWTSTSRSRSTTRRATSGPT